MTFRSGFVHWDSMRYVALLPFLGWVALGFLLDARRARAGLAPAGDAVAGRPRPVDRAHPGAAPSCSGALVRSVRSSSAACRRRARHGAKAAATAAAVHREPLFGAAAAVLDRQPAGTRVAVFGDQWIYPAFGARHHLGRSGSTATGASPRARSATRWSPGDLTSTRATFARTSRAAGSRRRRRRCTCPHPAVRRSGPPQHAALEALGDARLLHRDRAVAVWSLGR